MPKVLNKSKHGSPANSIYVGRPSCFGNPFIIGKHGTRAEVIALFEKHIRSDHALIRKIRHELRGKDLVCFCSPLQCHADVLLRIANAPLSVIVCGGRSYTDSKTVKDVLSRFQDQYGAFVLHQGNARGADLLAKTWAKKNKVKCVGYSADWDLGLKAGHLRNARMLKASQPDYVIAFPGGSGTRNMCKQARRAGVPILTVSDMLVEYDSML
jgi:hypothetical protein